MKFLAYIKFPGKHTLSQRLTCRKFIRERNPNTRQMEQGGGAVEERGKEVGL